MSTKAGWPKKVGIALLWVVIALEAFGMGTIGVAKFTRDWWVWAFDQWGYPQGFVWVVGAAEVGLALALLVPRLASWAAVGLSVIMVGALGTLLLRPGPSMGIDGPLIHLGLLAVIGTARWRVRYRRGSTTPSTSDLGPVDRGDSE